MSAYADDILIYKPILDDSSYNELQKDIDNIFKWSKALYVCYCLVKVCLAAPE